MRQVAPLVVLVAVTALLYGYGHTWSWVLGPCAAAALWALERKAHAPADPAPARARVGRDPAPVD